MQVLNTPSGTSRRLSQCLTVFVKSRPNQKINALQQAF
jgi:hypothetical protein